MDRREFFFSMGGAVLASAVVPSVSLKQQPLRFGEVRLKGGLLHDRYVLNANRTFAFSPDDILMPYFRAKGIPSRGKELNGEYAPKVQTGIWPGLYSTMWMSGAAHIARWSGDPSHAQTLARMVHELAKTQEPDGFLLAMGRSPQERWAHEDIYALVRSMVRCLLDIYEVTGDKLAIDLARGQMDCVYNDLQERRPPGGGIVLKNMTHPVTSYYKLVPALSQLFQHTGDERYLELADMCVDLPLINDLADGSKRDPLLDRHASTWTDFLMGIYQIGLASGNQRYVQAALNAWALIRERHLFITGSMSSGEHWQSGSNGWQLRETEHAQETCAAYSWVVFEQNLLQGTGEMVHADCIEEVAYNDLFASQNPDSGDFCYFLDLQGKDKPYDSPPAYGHHCCDGNGLTAIGRLAGLIYGKTADGIAINLYAGSEAVSDGVKITQETDYPASGTVLIRVELDQPRRFALRYRIPRWSSSALRVDLNGNRVEAKGTIARQWKSGDSLRLEFPMEQTILHDTRIGVVRTALRQGPVVFAGTWSDDLPVRMSGEIPKQGARSSVDVWPYVPSVIASSIRNFEAEALPPALQGSQPPSARVKVRFMPFHALTQGKYSVWLPEVQL
jgi:hypothetical protein